MPRKKKPKPLTWERVLKYHKEICLAMAVSGATDEEGRIKDNELLKRNGGSVSSYRWMTPVQQLLRWDNSEDLPNVWPKIIAEFAKPFVPGLTKKIAPQLRATYMERFYVKRSLEIKIHSRLRELDRKQGLHIDFSLSLLNDNGDEFNVMRAPVVLHHHVYIDYLRKKLRNPEFAKKFVDKYVIIPKSSQLREILRGRTYGENPKTVKFKKAIAKHGVALFSSAYPIQTLSHLEPLEFGKRQTLASMIEAKASQRRDGRSVSEFFLAKRKNKLYIILV